MNKIIEMKDLNKYIDHTQLKAFATLEDIKTLCEEAMKYNFYAVCVNGCHVKFTKNILQNSEVKIASVIGFPLGSMSTAAKVFEAEEAIKDGADEIDMVINIGWLKEGKLEKVKQDISAVKKAIGNKILKVIIETCYLSDEEKKTVCKLAVEAKADFVKTSTGFGTGGATIEDVKLMKEAVENKLQIKASGGIRDAETAKKYIKIGVDRIGTSSGIKIVENQ